MNSILLSSLLVLGLSTLGSEAKTILKAAAPSNNIRDCFCQCSSLTFMDNRGRVNGNCNTIFNGAQWCYITKEAAKNRDCPDAIPSRRFPGRMWSHFSCATPETRRCIFDAVVINVESSPTAFSSDPNSP
ncbi:Uncharacterized protein FKW44_001848 [Caligus rogercresseyi]|uniref:Uncharacterized protein n=1 Tax=Caligus rogercresseyi TaxID=217165 RepID=A0A7T8KJA5_CALRO|nr:Uncharacterized protein FKW44_001848 [Caligus rogercresseyi]